MRPNYSDEAATSDLKAFEEARLLEGFQCFRDDPLYLAQSRLTFGCTRCFIELGILFRFQGQARAHGQCLNLGVSSFSVQ